MHTMKRFKLISDCAWDRKASKLVIMCKLTGFQFSYMCTMRSHKISGLGAE